MESTAGLTLLHVLNNQCLLPVFTIYCRQQGVDEYLQFWFDVRTLQNRFRYTRSHSGVEGDECLQLFQKYFYPTSIHHIQVDPKLGVELQDNLKKQANAAQFALVQKFAYDVLDMKLKNFASSDAYKKFLKRESSLYQKRTQRVFDVHEIEAHFKRINESHKHLKLIYDGMNSLVQANAAATSSLASLSDRFDEFGASVNQSDCAVELEGLGNVLHKMAAIMKTLEELENNMHKLIVIHFQSLKKSISTEIPNAKTIQKKVEKGSPGDEAEALSQLRDSSNKIDHRTFQAMTQLMEQYLAYFEKGYTLIQTVIPELEKFRCG